MPYIEMKDRKFYDDVLQSLGTCCSPGHLNYVITKLCKDFIYHEHRYDKFNEVIGVLECAKQEFYRRMVAPYEDTKIEENGDVYE